MLPNLPLMNMGTSVGTFLYLRLFPAVADQPAHELEGARVDMLAVDFEPRLTRATSAEFQRDDRVRETPEALALKGPLPRNGLCAPLPP